MQEYDIPITSTAFSFLGEFSRQVTKATHSVGLRSKSSYIGLSDVALTGLNGDARVLQFVQDCYIVQYFMLMFKCIFSNKVSY